MIKFDYALQIQPENSCIFIRCYFDLLLLKNQTSKYGHYSKVLNCWIIQLSASALYSKEIKNVIKASRRQEKKNIELTCNIVPKLISGRACKISTQRSLNMIRSRSSME